MKLIELKKDKGQAAMTDSLFFLTIIVALCVLLFKFSSTYGERIDLAVNNLYFKEYTNSALKTMFYTDIPLDFNKDVENSLETDYLITAIKSDFLYNQKIGIGDINSLDPSNVKYLSKYNLFHTIKSIMYPLPNYDYLYYIQKSDGLQEIYFFMLKINNRVDEDTIETLYYLCEPDGLTSVRELVQKSNKIYSSSTPLVFKVNAPDISEIRAISNLTIWASTLSINKTYIEEVDSPLNCKEYID